MRRDLASDETRAPWDRFIAVFFIGTDGYAFSPPLQLDAGQVFQSADERSVAVLKS